MDVRYLLLLLLFVSCVPDSQAPRYNLSNSKGTTGGTSGGSSDFTDSVGGGPTNWNYLGSSTKSITINNSNLNTAYLIGGNVEGYLATPSNFTNANYCVVASYSIGGNIFHLRSRVVPISFYDFALKKTVRVLRIDFPDSSNSLTYCGGTLRVQDTLGNYVNESSPTGVRFSPSDICPNCTSILTSQNVRIFKTGTTLDEVPTNLINLSQLSLLLDPNNASTGNAGSCTNSGCQARGFDCCLDNQCVNDKAEKPSARTQYASLLEVANEELKTNPLAYFKYPQLYYICGSTVPSTTGGSTGGETSYDPALLQLQKDYSCVQSIKAQSTLSPFQQEILIRTSPYTASTDCLTADADKPDPQHYIKVVERLYTNCGCAQTKLEDMVPNCPAYDYVVAESSGGVPTRIECFTPPTEQTPLPTQMTVNVDSRSAPHRFFDNLTGAERKITEGETSYLDGTTRKDYQQEGSEFKYLDDAFIVPDQKTFSMNAILGQMSVALDKALPAKSVNIELDQVYQITTTTGLYSPCPTCGRDSWISSLTAFPISSYGNGLQAVGHSVTRDGLSTNTSGGNYEDTIFGRACWLPPTMIPFSQPIGFSSVQPQRELRLQTQAAMFVNGYQRDWFGFNKGALIGSFDGVTWFAIGSGRIVKATSSKLFLAINAPFADLATANMHVVNIVAYNGTNQAPAVDYDPQFHQHDQKQNRAGSCQANHMCETDTDCVTQLGWEYMCADVISVKTNWPKFKADGSEDIGFKNVTIDQILQQKKFPSGATKRCIYRGAGAPCKVNVATVTDPQQRKLLTCAPNFFCANLNSAGLFNSRISRYAASLEDLPITRNHLFGKDANVLGRPLNYLTGADSTLPGTVASTIRASFSNDISTGLCQPGKAIPQLSNEATLSNPYTQHQFSDPSRRTDYISQIGSCNSTLFTSNRYSSCPVINPDSGNYEMFEATFNTANNAKMAKAQNSCGLDSLNTTASLSSSADTLLMSSPFKAIEGKTLPTTTISDRTLVRDACLRRAGQACHTNLDCGPNKLHAEQVDYYPLSFFGNQAEKNYYSEHLICGQADPIPQPTDTVNFKNYDMTKNVCCREIGQDITTYTSDVALLINPTGVSATDLSKYDPASAGLLTSLPATSRAPGSAPNASKRYTRFATVEDLGVPTRPYLSSYQSRDTNGDLLRTTDSIVTENQWRTLREANSETCCGGGWIRKFSDGGNDWSKRNRVVLDVTNFSCINSRTVLLNSPIDVLGEYGTDFSSLAGFQNAINQDYGDYCKGGSNSKGACAQYSIPNSVTSSAPASDPYLSHIYINTVNPKYRTHRTVPSNPATAVSNLDYYFSPRSADADISTIIDYSSATTRRNIVLRIPSYVKTSTIDQVILSSSDDMTTLGCTEDVDGVAATGASAVTSPSHEGTTYCASGCCYHIDQATRVMKVALNAMPVSFTNLRVGVQFRVETPGTGTVPRFKPGSSLFYLNRLGKLELSGIPQIAYEPLYCSDNNDRVVPGIFNPAIAIRTDGDPTTTGTEFEDYRFAFKKGSTWMTNEKGLANEPIFSANDFKCCTPLGRTTNNQTKCCSGFGVAQGTSGNVTCSLPSGTDLMVYFNPFVSNEAFGSDRPGGGLSEDDFEPATGEPKFSATINQKIADMGIAYCASGRIRQGGAFGEFEPEPMGSDTDRSDRIYNLVDSPNDNGVVSNAGRTISVGYTVFTEGFRWNHHLYCDD